VAVPFTDPVQTKSALELDVQCLISNGQRWIDVNNRTKYRLGANTLSGRQVQFRRTQAQNPFVPGTYTVNSVPENVEESLEVWVLGDSHFEMDQAVEDLTSALSQVQFIIDITVGDSGQVWYCQTADYEVSMQREYLHNRIAKVNARIPRLPHIDRRLV
jgi:hypothetical protein